MHKNVKNIYLEGNTCTIDCKEVECLDMIEMNNVNENAIKNFLKDEVEYKKCALLYLSLDSCFNFYEYVEEICLENLEIQGTNSLVFPAYCKSISITTCTGEFDLSRIRNLEELKLIPPFESDNFHLICFNLNLKNVKKLEIAYNLNEKFITTII